MVLCTFELGVNFSSPPGESNGKKSMKRIKNEGPSILPDSAQGPPEGSNPIPHSLGPGLGQLPYWR